MRPDKNEKTGITISIYYCFINGEEDDDPSLPRVLIVWDDNHGCLWALPVERKAPVDWVVKWIVERLDNFGYRGQAKILKSDKETAILVLKTVVAGKKAGNTTNENGRMGLVRRLEADNWGQT